VAEDRPYYSRKHKRHGVNVQVLADAAGRLVWASPALPGATHDLTAARHHRLIDTPSTGNVMTFADKGYQAEASEIGLGGIHRPLTHRRCVQGPGRSARCGLPGWRSDCRRQRRAVSDALLYVAMAVQ
jgi:hypothetical protein